MNFRSKMHMAQELMSGKRFVNKHGDMIRYDESLPNNPFRISRYNNIDDSVPMVNEWNVFGQNIWTDVSPESKNNSLDIHSIGIITNKGEFDKFVLDEGVELEFNHTDHTMYFRPVAPLKPKSAKTVYEWLYKTNFTSDWEISPVLKSEEEAKDFFDKCKYKKTGREFEVEV
jgi:hypothetical protein